MVTKPKSFLIVSKLNMLQVMHARSGGTLEVMGLLQGKIDGDTMIVMDSFALPVEVSINFCVYS